MVCRWHHTAIAGGRELAGVLCWCGVVCGRLLCVLKLTSFVFGGLTRLKDLSRLAVYLKVGLLILLRGVCMPIAAGKQSVSLTSQPGYVATPNG
jgi:hypothetical protein